MPNLNSAPRSFYEDLVAPAEGFRSPELRKKIASASVLVAGAGSIGNPFAMTAVRSGIQHIIVADPEEVETGNLSRQEFTADQIGVNKAEATVHNLKQINWTASETLHPTTEGITAENVAELVSRADFIIDGIDVGALDMIFALHSEAARQRKPVFIGYDLAGTALVVYCPYDQKEIPPLNGELDERKMNQFTQIKEACARGDITKAQFIDFVYDIFAGPISPLDIPAEQLHELIDRDPDDERSYQLGTTARLVSVITMEAIVQKLDGQEINEKMKVDLPSVVRKHNPSFFEINILRLKALKLVRERGREVRRLVSSLNSSTSLYATR